MALLTKCQTPGAVFNTKITSGKVVVEVKSNKLRRLSKEQAELLEANLHNAIELVLAPFYVK